MSTPIPTDAVIIERHGEITLVIVTPALESLEGSLEEQMANVILSSLRGDQNPLIIFDLTAVDFFGSMFIAVLLRCWKQTNAKGGSMVLAGVSDHARELLRITSLDMIWPMYKTRREAMEALLSD
jgi:anti-sigma B factor antagonist